MSRLIYTCELCGEIYDKFKDYENCCIAFHSKKRNIEKLKIELAELLVAKFDENIDFGYFRLKSNELVNQIKELESEKV